MNHLFKPKLIRLLDTLNHGLVERESAIKAALLAVLAGENLLLVGPPGTAKSLIARRMADCLHHSDATAGYFEYLLTKFSTPEEIFGPLSISELKADRFRRNTAGYLPSVRLAFLDEIFKASSSILNALLTILNERIYHNGTEAQPVPLQALIAASNELPTGQEELEALYDRFLVRSFVDYVSEDGLPQLLSKPGPAPTLEPLTEAEVSAVRQAAATVTLPPEIVSALQRIWAAHKQLFKEDQRENLSDRRLKKAVGLLCVSAATNGRDTVDFSDLLLLKDCLWNHPDNALKVRELVLNTLRAFSHPVPLVGTPANAALANTGQRPTQAPPPSNGKLNAVVKGYKGSGTEQDPILIETLHDLAGLERPEVGQQGYWFRQTADIDASALTSWLNITFQGHYDGGENTITYYTGLLDSKGEEFAELVAAGHIVLDWVALFQQVKQPSHIAHLRLQRLGLAKKVNGSEIIACTSSTHLLGGVVSNSTIRDCEAGGSLLNSEEIIAAKNKNCTLTQCRAGGSLVNGDAQAFTIENCQAGGSLIAGSVQKSTIRQCCTGNVLARWIKEKSTIQDCLVQVNGWLDNDGGGIAHDVESSVVERCFVTGNSASSRLGSFGSKIRFDGITNMPDYSTIRQCALGSFELGPNVQLRQRIADSGRPNAKLENNIALDCHPGYSHPSGKDGQSVSAALWTQHYFEHNLGWDFDTIWQWNATQKQPELRAVGVAAFQQCQPASTAPAASEGMGDLLTEQLRANFWL